MFREKVLHAPGDDRLDQLPVYVSRAMVPGQSGVRRLEAGFLAAGFFSAI
jgi:hypothetical protein